MSSRQARWYPRVLLILLLVGGLLRLQLWYFNPPNNSYDDHLDPIARYAQDLNRLHPSDCWQCYQPPLYFVLSGVIVRSANRMGVSDWYLWNAVQAIGPLSSLVSLLCVAAILPLWLEQRGVAIMFGLACAVVLPRDIYTAAMVSNDALLLCAASVSFLGFSLIVRRDDRRGLVLLAIGVLAGCWTKQSGLLLLILPLGVLHHLWRSSSRPHHIPRRPLIAALLLGVVALGALDEAVRWRMTGRFLVSNQAYFDRATDQPPGSIEAVSFGSVRIGALLRTPWMSASTQDSFWTHVFARTWFDFEPRFFGPSALTAWTGRTMYMFGIPVAALFLLGAVRSMWTSRSNPTELYAHVTAGLFALVPLVQTLRYPYFSSMKAMFALPALAMGIVWISMAADVLAATRAGRRILIGLGIALILAGVFHGIAVAIALETSLVSISGPLWPFPALP